MEKVKSKVIEVEVIKWDGEQSSLGKLMEANIVTAGYEQDEREPDKVKGLTIKVPGGDMKVPVNSYIVKVGDNYILVDKVTYAKLFNEIKKEVKDDDGK